MAYHPFDPDDERYTEVGNYFDREISDAILPVLRRAIMNGLKVRDVMHLAFRAIADLEPMLIVEKDIRSEDAKEPKAEVFTLGNTTGFICTEESLDHNVDE